MNASLDEGKVNLRIILIIIENAYKLKLKPVSSSQQTTAPSAVKIIKNMNLTQGFGIIACVTDGAMSVLNNAWKWA